MLLLESGDWTAALLPERGAALARLAWRGREVLAPLPQGADPTATFAGAFLMAPWTNRLDAGRMTMDGTTWCLPVNRPQDRTAIHGLVRDHGWTVEREGDADAVLALDLDAPPFQASAQFRLSVTPDTVELALALTARGDRPQRLGIGWHPWFARPAGTRLAFGARWRCRHDSRQLPVAAEPFDRLEGDEARYLGLDTHFAGWDGTATICHPDGTRIRMVAHGAWATNLQVFAPSAAPVLCVEPVSHLPDAPNRPVLAALGPMATVRPGETIAGRITLAAG